MYMTHYDDFLYKTLKPTALSKISFLKTTINKIIINSMTSGLSVQLIKTKTKKLHCNECYIYRGHALKYNRSIMVVYFKFLISSEQHNGHDWLHVMSVIEVHTSG